MSFSRTMRVDWLRSPSSRRSKPPGAWTLTNPMRLVPRTCWRPGGTSTNVPGPATTPRPGPRRSVRPRGCRTSSHRQHASGRRPAAVRLDLDHGEVKRGVSALRAKRTRCFPTHNLSQLYDDDGLHMTSLLESAPIRASTARYNVLRRTELVRVVADASVQLRTKSIPTARQQLGRCRASSPPGWKLDNQQAQRLDLGAQHNAGLPQAVGKGFIPHRFLDLGAPAASAIQPATRIGTEHRRWGDNQPGMATTSCRPARRSPGRRSATAPWIPQRRSGAWRTNSPGLPRGVLPDLP